MVLNPKHQVLVAIFVIPAKAGIQKRLQPLVKLFSKWRTAALGCRLLFIPGGTASRLR
jgi:hypothetical protein